MTRPPYLPGHAKVVLFLRYKSIVHTFPRCRLTIKLGHEVGGSIVLYLAERTNQGTTSGDAESALQPPHAVGRQFAETGLHKPTIP